MKDQRKGFCYQELAALDLIRHRYSGTERATALAVYSTLTYLANEHRAEGGRDGFIAKRSEVAEAAGTSDRTLDKYVQGLEELGLVTVERKKKGNWNHPNNWTLLTPESGGEMSSPPPGRNGCAPQGGEMSSHPSSEEEEESPSIPHEQEPWEGRRVSRKPVTKTEWELGEAIISAFNAIAGTTLSLTANLVPVIGRIREKPQYTANHHERIIRAAFASPWWEGRPGIQVVYGRGDVFESAIETARAYEAAGGRPPGQQNQVAQEVQKTDEEMRKMNERGQQG